MKHLKFCCYWSHYNNDNIGCGHPQEVMKRLGIKYTHSTPQSMGNQWWFWNCTNLPEKLNGFLTELDLDPIDQVGYGLTEADALEIKAMSLTV